MKAAPVSSFRKWFTPQKYMSVKTWESIGGGILNFGVYAFLVLYLFPVIFMIFTAFMDTQQLGDRNAPIYPSRQVRYNYEGKDYRVYNVPIGDEVRELALVSASREISLFVDPAESAENIIEWEGNWRRLIGVYEFYITFESFETLFSALRLPQMLRNTMLMALITEVGVIISSLIVAYGFSRFPLPGGDFLFYILIATILIPEKVTLIPTYFIFVRVLGWEGTWFPILVPFFFGNAVYIFLMRQNFRSIPVEMDEAAMLDGAGPLRILFRVILPQSWPVVITASLLHFFYIWNETRQAALYLGIRRDLAPISFGIQNYQSLAPIQNDLQASALIIMVVPVLALLISQKYFMRDMVITGLEK
ncbi:carbohydrate ABC transporter permease [Chloroflexota bacterium]